MATDGKKLVSSQIKPGVTPLRAIVHSEKSPSLQKGKWHKRELKE